MKELMNNVKPNFFSDQFYANFSFYTPLKRHDIKREHCPDGLNFRRRVLFELFWVL